MSTTYLYSLEGWPSSPSSDNNVRRFNCDTAAWVAGTLAVPPFTGQVTSTSISFRQGGGWDGTYWYVIGPDGKLYRYDPSADSWSSALNGGVAVVGGTVEDTNWFMASDGRYVYILVSSGNFYRYNPVSDALSSLTTPGGGTYGNFVYLSYDGSDTIYAHKGGTGGGCYNKYVISTATWSTLPTVSSMNTDTVYVVWGAYLGGKFYTLYQTTSGFKVFSYNPASNTWTQKTSGTNGGFIVDPVAPFSEITDAIIALFDDSSNNATYKYDTGADSWSSSAVPLFKAKQGANWACARTFSPSFTWYLADGTTLAGASEYAGSAAVGATITYHLVVKTPVDHAAGATISVPALPSTDADDAVTICATSTGTYGTSFTTGALTANQTFDVWVKIVPTSGQTPGFGKTFNLKVVGN